MISHRDREAMLALADKVFADRKGDPHLVKRWAAGVANEHDRRAIIDVIAAELCEKGLGSEAEPSSYGQTLERLIDCVNRPNLKPPSPSEPGS